MRVPSKVLIFVSTLVSTVLSLVAGYLLYAESISVLRSAVDSASDATTRGAVNKLASLLDQSIATTHELRKLLTKQDQLATISTSHDHLEALYWAAAFASLSSSPFGYSTAYLLIKDYDVNGTLPPPWQDPNGHSRMSIYYDPVLDHEGNSAKHWRAGKVFYSNATTFEWTRHTFSLDNDTGEYVYDPRPSYEFTVTDDVSWWYGWILNVSLEGRWSDPFFWDSVDGTPYAYNSYQIRHKVTVDNQLYHFVFIGHFMFQPWSEVIREFEAADANLVVFDSHAFRVYAHTLHDGPVVSEDCHSRCFSCATGFSGGECLPAVTALGRTISGAVNASLVRPVGAFFVSNLGSTSWLVRVRHGKLHADGEPPAYKLEYNATISMSGGEYFMRRAHAYTAGSVVFNLLWLRSVSSVNSEVFAALVQLIVVCVVIFVVDLAIAVTEVVLISRPLHHLAKACQHLETMDLEAAEETAHLVYTPVMVTEVAKVAAGLRYAADGLKDYKAYLPKILFASLGEEEEEEESVQPESADKSKESSSKSSLAREELATSRSVSFVGIGAVSASFTSSNGTIARVQFDGESYTTFPHGFSQIVDQLYETGRVNKGLVHTFSPSDPLCFTVTWNVGVRCPDGVRYALQFCEDICKSEVIRGLTLPTAAISAGVVQSGALGSAAHRGFSMTGTPVEQIQAVSAMSLMLSVKHGSAVTLATPQVVEAAAGVYLFHALTLLHLKKLGPTVLVSQAVVPVKVNPGEWMYQLEDAEKGWSNPLLPTLRKAKQGAEEEGEVSVDVSKEATALLEWGAANLLRGKTTFGFGIHEENT